MILDLSRVGELERVAGEVHEHLLQPERVADQYRRDPGGDCRHSSTPFSAARGDSVRATSSTQLPDRNCDRLDGELARLDLRQVEDVVDDPEQRCPEVTIVWR